MGQRSTRSPKERQRSLALRTSPVVLTTFIGRSGDSWNSGLWPSGPSSPPANAGPQSVPNSKQPMPNTLKFWRSGRFLIIENGIAYSDLGFESPGRSATQGTRPGLGAGPAIAYYCPLT
jgi:hypothetical protein